jgi:hypothetical protein
MRAGAARCLPESVGLIPRGSASRASGHRTAVRNPAGHRTGTRARALPSTPCHSPGGLEPGHVPPELLLSHWSPWRPAKEWPRIRSRGSSADDDANGHAGCSHSADAPPDRPGRGSRQAHIRLICGACCRAVRRRWSGGEGSQRLTAEPLRGQAATTAAACDPRPRPDSVALGKRHPRLP